MTNPTILPTSLLKPLMPQPYLRNMIYDPTDTNPLYNSYIGQKIVPAVGSVVQDYDLTPLWVISVDPVTYVPTYTAIPLSTENDNVVSLLNYGNSVLRLYTDYRSTPYPVTPDSKCIFVGKSPRFYTLSRYPNSSQETIISNYYDSTGQLTSQMVPLKALDDTHTSWYLQRCHIAQILEHNEEVKVKIYNEDGVECYSAILFAKESSIINNDVVYSPTIVGMTISSNQILADGTHFLYEKQDFLSLGLTATLVYDDGSTLQVPIDGQKCILYGQNDFISSFSGLKQYVTVKYFRSENEAINPGISDATGEMISIKVPVTVIPNTLGVTVKIVPMPIYNASLSRYVVRYWMYFGDGRSPIDITAYATIVEGNPVTSSSHFGIQQTWVVGVDMKSIDPTHYPTSALYQQTIVMTFNGNTQLVKYTWRDSETSQNVFGIDVSGQRRPSLRWDANRGQIFNPTSVFGNVQAFLNSYYYKTTPIYDPSISLVPQNPTHFLIRDAISGAMLCSAPIPVASYSVPFNVIGDATAYVGGIMMVEFLSIISLTERRTLMACPVDVRNGSYVNP